MNLTTTRPEDTRQSIERYPTDNPGSEPHATEFAVMNEQTWTTDLEGQTQTRGNGCLNGVEWEYIFRNVFTRTHWQFRNNGKRGNAVVKNFYMSNVIAHQFEWTFQRNGWLLELPETIERYRIVNNQALRVLLRHQSDYHSDAFRKDFLETTVNGKSTVRVAQDLGLKIGQLTVTYYDKPIDKIDEAMSCSPGEVPFSVIVHVSPDPAVYST